MKFEIRANDAVSDITISDVVIKLIHCESDLNMVCISTDVGEVSVNIPIPMVFFSTEDAQQVFRNGEHIISNLETLRTAVLSGLSITEEDLPGTYLSFVTDGMGTLEWSE